jgi:hypothetical protein
VEVALQRVISLKVNLNLELMRFLIALPFQRVKTGLELQCTKLQCLKIVKIFLCFIKSDIFVRNGTFAKPSVKLVKQNFDSVNVKQSLEFSFISFYTVGLLHGVPHSATYRFSIQFYYFLISWRNMEL